MDRMSHESDEAVMKNALAWLVSALLLSACSTNPEAGRTERPAEQAGESRASPDVFFAGRWAPDAAACPDAAWLITEDGLQTPGEVTCRFEQRRQTTRGVEAHAVCVAEGPPQRWRLKFTFAESADALLIEDAPFADAGLVRCAKTTTKNLPDALSVNGVNAADAVQRYFELLAADRVDEARRLRVTDDGHDELARRLAGFANGDIAVGPAGRVEGAAGSLYVNVPVTMTGDTADRFGNVTLRRSNNVPGATPEQRSWRIFGIEWQGLEGE